jgi:hypothetical protein
LEWQNSWYYNFGDGWGAAVDMRVLEPGQKRSLNKINAGFCGYNWMVDSILNCGAIKVETKP